ncbi:MAG: hypothetical protein HOF01_03785 [Chloroflexi bacterium]|nr:hypothetical protein [Chloroflexota bacterium]
MFSGTKNKWLVLVAIAALAAFVIACGTDETKLVSNDGSGGVGAQPTAPAEGDEQPGGLGYEVVEALAPIESVEILVLESYPEQYVVQIISGIPGGCATFDRADVAQSGTDIHITVYNMVPAPDQMIACTAIYGIHDENVSLGSDFERGTVYSVYVNDQPAVTLETGSSPIQDDPPYRDPGFGIIPAPVEAIEIIIGEDSRGPVTYYANVIIGLTNGCNEAVDPNVVQTSELVFEVFPVVKVPTGDVACTDDYRLAAVEVEFGVVGEELISCAVYTVKAGDKSTTFQAIAPNVRCADPDAATPTPAPITGGGSIIADSQALELALRSLGADVSYGGQKNDSKQFGLFPTEMKVNGQQVLVYSFAPGTSAEKASETVSNNGSSFTLDDGSVMTVHWIANPHFYLSGNAIILYIGDDAEIGKLLGSIGDQFAGNDYEASDSGDDDGLNAEFTSKLGTIERVSIASTRSIPAQHMIGVTIALGGSCETFKSITKTVEGREVHIEVLTEVPTAPVPCTLAIIYDDQSINIGSDFEAGVEYDVIVNGERQGSFFGG